MGVFLLILGDGVMTPPAALAAIVIITILTRSLVIDASTTTTAFYTFNVIPTPSSSSSSSQYDYRPSTVNFTDDAPFETVPLKFTFPFFNEAKTVIRISPNGELSFSSTPPCCASGGVSCSFGSFFCNFGNSYRNIIGGLVADFNPSYCQPGPSLVSRCNGITSNIDYSSTSRELRVRFQRLSLYVSAGNVGTNRFTYTVSIVPSGRITVDYIDIPSSNLAITWMAAIRHLSTLTKYAYTNQLVVNQYANTWGGGVSGSGIYVPRTQVTGGMRTLTWWPLADVCVWPRVAPLSGGTRIRWATTFYNVTEALVDMRLKCRFHLTPTHVDVVPTYNATTNTLDCLVPSVSQPMLVDVRLVINDTVLQLPYTAAMTAATTLNYSNHSTSAYDSEGPGLCHVCGVSSGVPAAYCTFDCKGVWQGKNAIDSCGVCGGLEQARSCNNECFGRHSMRNEWCVCAGDNSTLAEPTSKCFRDTGLLPYPPASTAGSTFCVSPRYGLYNTSVNVTISSSTNVFRDGVQCVWGGKLGGNRTVAGIFHNTTTIVCPLLITANTTTADASLPLRVLNWGNTSVYSSFAYTLVSLKSYRRIQSRAVVVTAAQHRCIECAFRAQPACTWDCFGQVFGSAYKDVCNTCVAGITGLTAGVEKDCAGFCRGPFTGAQCVCPSANSSTCRTLITNRADTVRTTTAPYFYFEAPAPSPLLASAVPVRLKSLSSTVAVVVNNGALDLPFGFRFGDIVYHRAYATSSGGVYFDAWNASYNVIGGLLDTTTTTTAASLYAMSAVSTSNQVSIAFARPSTRFEVILDTHGGIVLAYRTSVVSVNTSTFVGTRPGVEVATAGTTIPANRAFYVCTASLDICVSSTTIAVGGGTVIQVSLSYVTCGSSYTGMKCAFGTTLVPAVYNVTTGGYRCVSVSGGTVGSVIAFALTTTTTHTNQTNQTTTWRSAEIPLTFVTGTVTSPVSTCSSTVVASCDNGCGVCQNTSSADCGGNCFGPLVRLTDHNDGGECGCRVNDASKPTGYYAKSDLGGSGVPLVGAFESCLFYAVQNGNQAVARATVPVEMYRLVLLGLFISLMYAVPMFSMLAASYAAALADLPVIEGGGGGRS